MSLKSIPLIPANERLVEVGGKLFRKRVRRGRKGPKLSKKHRDSIARAAKKFKVPVLTIGANAIPIMNGIRVFATWPMRQIATDAAVQAQLFNGVVSPYLGLEIQPSGTSFKANFAPGRLIEGLVPNALLKLMKSQRILQAVNKQFNKLGLPVGLN